MNKIIKHFSCHITKQDDLYKEINRLLPDYKTVLKETLINNLNEYGLYG